MYGKLKLIIIGEKIVAYCVMNWKWIIVAETEMIDGLNYDAFI